MILLDSPELTILPLNTEQEKANGNNTFLSGLGNHPACSHNQRMIKNDDGNMEYLCKGQQRCRCSNNNMMAESQKKKR